VAQALGERGHGLRRRRAVRHRARAAIELIVRERLVAAQDEHHELVHFFRGGIVSQPLLRDLARAGAIAAHHEPLREREVRIVRGLAQARALGKQPVAELRGDFLLGAFQQVAGVDRNRTPQALRIVPCARCGEFVHVHLDRIARAGADLVARHFERRGQGRRQLGERHAKAALRMARAVAAPQQRGDLRSGLARARDQHVGREPHRLARGASQGLAVLLEGGAAEEAGTHGRGHEPDCVPVHVEAPPAG